MRFPSRWARSEALSAAPPGRQAPSGCDPQDARSLPPALRVPFSAQRRPRSRLPLSARCRDGGAGNSRGRGGRGGARRRGFPRHPSRNVRDSSRDVTARELPPAERSGVAPLGGSRRAPPRAPAGSRDGSREVWSRGALRLGAAPFWERGERCVWLRACGCRALESGDPRLSGRRARDVGPGAAQRRGRAVGLRGGKEKEEEEAEEAARRVWGGTAARGSEPPCSLPRRGAPGKEGGPVAGSAGTAEPVPSPTRHKELGGAGVSRSGLSRGRESPAAPSGPRSAPL